jgi:2-polyprenyl-3-methyl-5-hydroxy-6-metoxy-1,4-benzoquinol methylase
VNRDLYVELNRAYWNELVPIHAASAMYDLEHFDATGSREWLDNGALGDVRGKRLLHLQCHIGTDTLSWARHGAKVTGVDFSPAAIDVARDLGAKLALTAEFVCADLDDLSRVLGRRFEVVYTSYGVLTWLPELASWARMIAELIETGGRFYMVDTHPFVRMFGRHFGRLKSSYFHTDEPRISVEDGSYAEPEAILENKTRCEWQHTVSDIVNALSTAGLTIDELRELPYLMFQRFPEMVRGDDGWWRLPDADERFPLLLSILATKR